MCDECCQQLPDKHQLSRVQTFHSDDWQSYRKVIPSERHVVDKSETQRIERRNLDFRTRLKRLH